MQSSSTVEGLSNVYVIHPVARRPSLHHSLLSLSSMLSLARSSLAPAFTSMTFMLLFVSLNASPSGVSPRPNCPFRFSPGRLLHIPSLLSTAFDFHVTTVPFSPSASALRVIFPASLVLLTRTLFTPHSTGRFFDSMKFVGASPHPFLRLSSYSP